MPKNNSLNKFGWRIIAVLSAVPVLLWLPRAEWSLNGLGRAAGLAGFAMFALVLILSARLKFFEKFFNGINGAYSAHHFFGGLAFCLLLSHPVLLALNYLSYSLKSAVIFLLPDFYLPKTLGSMALFLMIVALWITFYVKIKYHIWKFTHKFMGIAFILAASHVFLISNSIRENYALKIYFFVLSLFAISAYFYRAILGAYLVKTFKYSVKNIVSLPDKIWEIELKPEGKPIRFSAGQFAFFKFFSQAVSKEIQPFSFSSAPDSAKIAIKELGDYTKNIGKLKIGDRVKIEGPFGAFDFQNCRNKNQIWIAGGVGIAPFMGMLRSINSKDYEYNINLYFSVKNKDCLPFKQEIEEISERNKNIKFAFWLTDKMGLITAGSIKEKTENFEDRDIFICGPNIMMQNLKNQLMEIGISKEKIHTEEFKMY